MASSSSAADVIKVSYQRLKHESNNWLDEDEYKGLREKAMGRLRKSRLRRLHITNRWRRPRINDKVTMGRLKIPGLRRYLRRKARLVKIGLKKVYKRLKESQSHFGDLFAGNYLFMQVTPTPVLLKYDLHHHHPHTNNKSISFAKGGSPDYHPHPHRHHRGLSEADIPSIN